MKKLILTIFTVLLFSPVSFAEGDFFKLHIFHNDEREIKSLLNSQVKYANKNKFDKFISTYDKGYKNADGLNLENYSQLVKDVWSTYDDIKYDIKIKDIEVNDNSAIVKLTETSEADISVPQSLDGFLISESDSIYYLEKVNGNWKVKSDKVLKEETSMLYGDARALDIKLYAPLTVKPGEEYTASLEFTPPPNVIAIASIAKDKIEYPQKQTKEVFRKLPEDNILERIFISNTDNINEYVIASIGLTKANLEDLSIKFSLTGFGYKIIRVNLTPESSEENNEPNK